MKRSLFCFFLLLNFTTLTTAQLHYEGMIYDGLGKPQLENAADLTVSPDGKHIYAVSYDDNAVNVFNVDPSTGVLDFVETQKTGVGNVENIDGPYGLNVSPDGNHVYIVSSLNHSIVIFRRNVNDGKLSYLETITDNENQVDGLEGCFDMTISPDGNHVYITASDENAVSVFRRNVVTGSLTFIQMMKDGENGMQGLNYPLGINMSKDGNHIYVAAYGSNAINVFERNQMNGELTFVENQMYDPMMLPELGGVYDIETSHDGQNVYATGNSSNALVQFSRDTETGQLTYQGGLVDDMDGNNGLFGATGIRISNDDKSIYVAGSNEDAIAVYDRDEMTGMLSFSAMIEDGAGASPAQSMEYPLNFAINPADDQLYVVSFHNGAIVHFSRSEDGQLTYASVADGSGVGIDGLGSAEAVAIDDQGKYLYVVGNSDDAVAVFERDEMTGMLSAVQVVMDGTNGVENLNGASDVLLSPDGQHLYVTSFWDNSINVFEVDPMTGMITFLEVHTNDLNGITTMDGANGIAISPDGQTLLVTSFWDNGLVSFNRNTTSGSLTLSQQFTDGQNGIDGLARPASVTFNASGDLIYLASNFDDAISIFGNDVVMGEITYLNTVFNNQDEVIGLQGIEDLIINPTGDKLFAVSSEDNALVTFAIDENSGGLTFESMMTNDTDADGLEGASSIAMSEDGLFLYTTSIIDDAVSVFRLDGSTGSYFHQKTIKDSDMGVDGLSIAKDIIVSPSGRHMYVTSNGDDAVSIFSCTYNTQLTQIICEGDSVIVGSSIYQTSGFYKDTFSIGSCNSIISLDLTVHPAVTEMDVQICQGEEYFFAGEPRSTAGTYTETMTSYIGCDSTVMLHLAVVDAFENETVTAIICDGESFAFGDNLYYNSGTYQEELMSNSGCDSTISLDLTVLTKEDIFLTEFICPGEFYVLGNSNYINSGIYTETFTANNGCDSTVTVDLTVLNDSQATLTRTICQGESFELNGNSYSTSGTYVEQITTQGGCQSEITLELTVSEPAEEMLDFEVCSGESIEVGGNVYTLTGVYTLDLVAANGCDSTVIVDLVVNEEIEVGETVVSDDGTNSGSIDIEISGGTAPYSFSWSNGETTEDITNLEQGSYSVEITDANDCVVTRTFEVQFVVSNNELSKIKAEVTAFPNPLAKEQYVNLMVELEESTAGTIKLIDMHGKTLIEERATIEAGRNNYNLKMPSVSGLYLIQVISEKGIIGSTKITVL